MDISIGLIEIIDRHSATYYLTPQHVQAPQQSHVPQEQSEQSQASQSHLLQHVTHSHTSQVQADLAAGVTTVATDVADCEQQPDVQACDSPAAHSLVPDEQGWD